MRDQVHELIDTLADHELPAFIEFFERLEAIDGFGRSLLLASLREPEELSEEDLEALREAEEGIAAGWIISSEDLWREFHSSE